MPDAVQLETVTAAKFAPHTGSLFQLASPGGEMLALTLLEAVPLGPEKQPDGQEATPPGRRPFSLLFAGPVTPPLVQQIYPLRHEALGALDIFLVPVGETAERREYQAVFS